ncbi:hypothetical protein ACFSFY_14955 [Sporosarcina siberiensis]|uniref:Uncharacterized protein n=1 Tax=Sporosarcina siberiensis TaxID=1365606 RepID=A0ABW4SLL7_9BACL
MEKLFNVHGFEVSREDREPNEAVVVLFGSFFVRIRFLNFMTYAILRVILLLSLAYT